MLTSAGAAILAALGAIIPAAAPDVEQVVCPPSGTVCYVVVESPGTAGSGQASEHAAVHGGPQPACFMPVTDEPMACSDPTFGWWSNADGCYFQRLDPPPPATALAWEGHYPDGAVYQETCFGYSGTGGGWVWRSVPPQGYGGAVVTVEALAAEAVEQLDLLGPDIGLAPDPAKTGLVGLPVWMWTRVSQSTWGPVSATASVPGMSVTATANAVRIVWDMGDGHRVTCDGPGTPYAKGVRATSSPTCGHVYTRSSTTEPDAVYAITATTTWDIRWSGSGSSGQLTQTRSSSASLRIGELQVLVS